MTLYHHPVIVIGGTENALSVTRGLGRHGIPVYSLVDRPDASIYSRYCQKYYVVPGVTSEPRLLAQVLRRLAADLPHRGVLFPVSDFAVAAVAQLLPTFPTHYCAPLSPLPVMETLLLKTRFYRSLAAHGIPYPRTLFPEDPAFPAALDALEFPVIVKPAHSQRMRQRLGQKGFLAASRRDLQRYLQLTQRHGLEVVVQEVIPGPASNNYALDGYLDRHHELIAFFPRQVLRIWPLFFGNSSACTSLPLQDVQSWKTAVTQYLQTLRYRGLFNAHYKIDARDGVGKLLEINARSVGGGGVANTFPAFCGIDLLLTAYRDALELDRTVSPPYRVGAHVLNSQNELCCLLAQLWQRRFSLRQYLATIQGPRHWTLWARDDWNPFIASYAHRFREVVRLRPHMLRGEPSTVSPRVAHIS